MSEIWRLGFMLNDFFELDLGSGLKLSEFSAQHAQQLESLMAKNRPLEGFWL